MTARRLTRFRVRVTGAALMVLWTGVAAANAAFTEPDAIYYGTVSSGGFPLISGAVVSARQNGEVLAAYRVGSDPAAGDFYILRVPIVPADSGEPPSGYARVGDTVSLYVGDAAVGATTIRDRGTARVLNLDASATVTPGVGTPGPGATTTPGGPGETPPPATPTPVVGETPATTPTSEKTPALEICVGDCTGDGRVTISELVLGVRILSGDGSAERCAAFDANGDDTLSIDEVIGGVSSSLRGCP